MHQWTVLTLTLVFIGLSGAAYDARIHYIANSVLGSFFVAPNMTMREQEIKWRLNKTVNDCSCKYACLAVDCSAWSVTRFHNGHQECQLGTKSPYIKPPVGSPGSTYYFLQSSIPGSYSFRADGLLYLELPWRRLFTRGKTVCETIPGHRVLHIKTQIQVDIIKSIIGNQPIQVDLVKSDQGLIETWGDGTPFNETVLYGTTVQNDLPENNVYAFNRNHTLQAMNMTSYMKTVCQANPLNTGW
ncbi:hypothetical protein SK128_022070 [Halocaridina rubra]|uniref:Apple domain-containing protein n=1 Tax=Halocaridina rubra TaxID=373956 RepID=A0AAN9A002_HALRR